MKYSKDIVIQKMRAAIASNDHATLLAIVSDQVTDIALENPKDLHDAIKKSGINISDSLSPKYLCDLVADNLYTNNELADNLESVIAKNTYMSDDGNIGQYVTAGATALSGLVGGIGAMVAAGKQNKAAAATADAAKVAAQEATKQSMNAVLAEKEKSKGLLGSAEASLKSTMASNKPLMIGLGVVAFLGILGIGAYFFLSEDRIKAGEIAATPIPKPAL